MANKPTFNAWLAKARLNEAFVYHRENEPRSTKDFIDAYNAWLAGLVFLSQRKVAGLWYWEAIYCRRQDRTVLDRVSRGIRVAPSSAFLQQAA